MSKQFDEGEKAFYDGEDYSANPYQHLSADWEEWREGWYYAQHIYFMEINSKPALGDQLVTWLLVLIVLICGVLAHVIQ